jgi:tRNA pseudouridine55 synthase
VGSATRLLRFLTGARKEYVAEIVLGVATTTLDASGEVVSTTDLSHVTPVEVAEAATRFVGHIEQIPPMVSAVKIGGRRLHELAREGKEVDRPPRPVHVSRFTLSPLDASGPHPVYRAEVECSSGTYIRTLAADLGAALGGGAHLRALRRTVVGPFTVAEAHPLEALELLPVTEVFRGITPVVVDDDTAAFVRHGRVLEQEALGATGEGPWPVVDRSGELLAVYEPHGPGRTKPAMVLASGRGDAPLGK